MFPVRINLDFDLMPLDGEVSQRDGCWGARSFWCCCATSVDSTARSISRSCGSSIRRLRRARGGSRWSHSPAPYISKPSPIALAICFSGSRLLPDPDAWVRGADSWGYVRLILRGRIWRPEQLDLAQMGGDFVFDREGNLTLSHVSASSDDRPSVGSVMAAFRRAASANTGGAEP